MSTPPAGPEREPPFRPPRRLRPSSMAVYVVSHLAVAAAVGWSHGLDAARLALMVGAVPGLIYLAWARLEPPLDERAAPLPPPAPVTHTPLVAAPVPLAPLPAARALPLPLPEPEAAAPQAEPEDEAELQLDDKRRVLLVVYAQPSQPAWREVEAVLDKRARSWKLLAQRDESQASVFEYRVRLKKKVEAEELLAELKERATAGIDRLELRTLQERRLG